jgi:hypothetical protein
VKSPSFAPRRALAATLLALLSWTASAQADSVASLVAIVRPTLDVRAVAALARIDGSDRQLLAARSYLRAGSTLAARWSWTEAEVASYRSSAEYRDVLAAVEKVIAAFEAQNAGYTLYVNREVRSLDVQLARWNENTSVGATASALRAAALAAFPNPGAAKVAQLRDFLVAWRPSPAATLAAPGLSPHGQLRAFDFQVEKDGRIVAGTTAANAATEWDAAGWTDKLRRAVAAASPRMKGPLASPREPWHYTFAP